jgi:hypothetical protein
VQEFHPTLVRVKATRTKLVTAFAKQNQNLGGLTQGCHQRGGIAMGRPTDGAKSMAIAPFVLPDADD